MHPQATLAEIEEELDRQLGRVRAQLLGDLALASRAAEVGRASAEERPRCAECGGRLISEEGRQRRVRTVNNQVVELERDYATCTACGSRFFGSVRTESAGGSERGLSPAALHRPD